MCVCLNVVCVCVCVCVCVLNVCVCNTVPGLAVVKKCVCCVNRSSACYKLGYHPYRMCVCV